ncbi:MAG: sugar phosphate isomerase/epimerase family protein [Methanobacteriaceae archaeon]|nr:sugar phosphate isomerase/epimerase family protein [Methanobacteriaceae archaeon]
MEISVSTLGLYPMSITEVLDFVTKQNIKNCEIVKEEPYYTLKEEDFASYNIKPSIHAPMSDVNIASHIEKIREISINEMIDAFKMANDIGAQVVVVHPGTVPIMGRKYMDKILKNNLNSLKTCQKKAEEYNVTMCVENMPLFENALFTDVYETFKLVDEVKSHMTLDIGHANNNGFTADEMLDYDMIGHIHLSDNDGSFDQHLALGLGNIDVKRVFNILNERKYSGVAVIEVKTLDHILKSIDYLKNINIL